MRTFFGLNDEYIEQVYEQFFILKHHGGWSLFERLLDEYEKEKKASEKARRKRR